MSLPDVRTLLPHRGQYLVIDQLLALDDQHAVASRTFQPHDVDGHFPGNPIVPGVILLEGLAQTMACLAQHLQPGGDEPLLAGFDKARFKAPVRPPAQVEFQVQLVEQRFGLVMGSGKVLVDGRIVCRARLTGAFHTRES